MRIIAWPGKLFLRLTKISWHEKGAFWYQEPDGVVIPSPVVVGALASITVFFWGLLIVLTGLLLFGCATGDAAYKKAHRPKPEQIEPIIPRPKPYTWPEITRNGVPDFTRHEVARESEVIKIGKKDAKLKMTFPATGFTTYYILVRYNEQVYGIYGATHQAATAYDLRQGISRSVQGVVIMKESIDGRHIPTKIYIDLGLIKEGQPSGVFALAKGRGRADLVACFLDHRAGLTSDPRCAQVSLENFE